MANEVNIYSPRYLAEVVRQAPLSAPISETLSLPMSSRSPPSGWTLIW